MDRGARKGMRARLMSFLSGDGEGVLGLARIAMIRFAPKDECKASKEKWGQVQRDLIGTTWHSYF